MRSTGKLYGNNAGGHHLTNVLLHAATTVLLFLALWRMTGDIWPSALATAIFAIHPLRAESVAWVSERKDLLSGLCFALTLLAYAGYARRRFSVWRYALVLVAFALGLLAKSMLVTVPLVLLLLDYWPLGRLLCREGETGRRGDGETSRSRLEAKSPPLPSLPSPSVFPSRVIWEKVPLLFLAACDGWMTLFGPRHGVALQPDVLLVLADRQRPDFLCELPEPLFLPQGPGPRAAQNLALSPWSVVAASAVLIAVTAAVLIPVGRTFLSARRGSGNVADRTARRWGGQRPTWEAQSPLLPLSLSPPLSRSRAALTWRSAGCGT